MIARARFYFLCAPIITDTSLETMRCSLRRSLSLLPTVLIYLAFGVQFSIILPTVWDYLFEKFQAERWFYSLSVSATSLVNVVVGPVFGALYDKTHFCKPLVLTAVFFAASGCFVYSVAASPYMVLGGRLIQGVGLASGAVISGEMARTTTKKERTTIYSMLTASMQVGYIMGPGFNLFLRYCDFQLGPFKVDKHTSPGFFMTVSWLVIGAMFFLCFSHLPSAGEYDSVSAVSSFNKLDVEDELDDKSEHVYDDESSRMSDAFRFAFEKSYEVLEIAGVNGVARVVPYVRRNSVSSETSGLLKHQSSCTLLETGSDYGSVEESTPERDKAVCRSCCDWLCSVSRRICTRLLWGFSMLIWEEIVLLLYVIHVMIFCEMAVEVSFPPIAKSSFQWNELPVSIFFSVAGALMIVMAVMVSLISKRVSDRWMLLTGLVTEVLGCIWLMGWLFHNPDGLVVVPQFTIGTVVVLLTEPISLGSGVSLFSKLLRPEVQGLGHGMRRSLVSLGSLLGSLWTAVALQLNSVLLLYGAPVGLVLLAIVLTVMSFNKLKE